MWFDYDGEEIQNEMYGQQVCYLLTIFSHTESLFERLKILNFNDMFEFMRTLKFNYK